MKTLVYGAAEFGQVVKNLAQNCGYEFVAFIDDYAKTTAVETYEQVKQFFPQQTYGIVIAVGYKDLKTRWAIYQKVKADGYKVPSLVHPQAIVDKTARIGEGAIIMAGAIVDYNVEIKDLAVLWNGVNISHDSIVGENTFLCPSVTVCGCSSIGRGCLIGANATITDHKKILDGSFIKAGSVNA